MKRRFLDWFKKNWKWAVPVLLLAVIINSGILFTIPLKSTFVYKESLRMAQSDERVGKSLGGPISPGLFVFGNIQSAEGAYAFIEYSIKGSKQSGHLVARARKTGGEWVMKHVKVIADNGEEYYRECDENGDWVLGSTPAAVEGQ